MQEEDCEASIGYLEVQDVSSGYSELLEASKWVPEGVGDKQ